MVWYSIRCEYRTGLLKSMLEDGLESVTSVEREQTAMLEMEFNLTLWLLLITTRTRGNICRRVPFWMEDGNTVSPILVAYSLELSWTTYIAFHSPPVSHFSSRLFWWCLSIWHLAPQPDSCWRVNQLNLEAHLYRFIYQQTNSFWEEPWILKFTIILSCQLIVLDKLGKKLMAFGILTFLQFSLIIEFPWCLLIK